MNEAIKEISRFIESETKNFPIMHDPEGNVVGKYPPVPEDIYDWAERVYSELKQHRNDDFLKANSAGIKGSSLDVKAKNTIIIVAYMLKLQVPEHAIEWCLKNDPASKAPLLHQYGYSVYDTIQEAKRWLKDDKFRFALDSQVAESFEKLATKAYEENVGSVYDFLEQKRIAQDGLALILRDIHRRDVESVLDRGRQGNNNFRNFNRPDVNIPQPPRPSQAQPRRGIRGR
jgi:hypothetical protein